MTDDWEQRITQLGLTKTTHEYAMYQLFSTALGWSAWRAFLPDKFANHKLLITRAIRLLTAATIRPAHARPPHPTWVTAVRQIFRRYHPQGKVLFLRACFPPQHVTVPVQMGLGMLTSLGSLRDRILGSQSMKCSMNLTASGPCWLCCALLIQGLLGGRSWALNQARNVGFCWACWVRVLAYYPRSVPYVGYVGRILAVSWLTLASIGPHGRAVVGQEGCISRHCAPSTSAIGCLALGMLGAYSAHVGSLG